MAIEIRIVIRDNEKNTTSNRKSDGHTSGNNSMGFGDLNQKPSTLRHTPGGAGLTS